MSRLYIVLQPVTCLQLQWQPRPGNRQKDWPAASAPHLPVALDLRVKFFTACLFLVVTITNTNGSDQKLDSAGGPLMLL